VAVLFIYGPADTTNFNEGASMEPTVPSESQNNKQRPSFKQLYQENRRKPITGKDILIGILIILVVIALAVFGISKLIDGISAQTDKPVPTTQQKSEAVKAPNTNAPVPSFDQYLNKSMAEIASEFNQSYDPAKSVQIHAEKSGYKLYFEDGGRLTATTKEKTGKANITSIELPQLSKCSQSQVFNKIDDAMRLVGLDPKLKGSKHDGVGGTQQGYGSYRGYRGDEKLEMALLCDYNGDLYKLQLRILPEYR
jgi:hypothetical protein